MVSTTSASVTTSHGGSFPFITHGPAKVVDEVVVVVVEYLDVLVENNVLVDVVVVDTKEVEVVVVVNEI